MGLPYTERRARLDDLHLNGEHWRTPAAHVGEGRTLLAATRELGLEGVIAKRLDSRYAPGRRDDGWLKIKHIHRQEAVIGGWTEGKGARSASIGALHLGVHDEQGALRYAGRVGTGFDEAELERLAGLRSREPTRRSPGANRRRARTTSSRGWCARSSSPSGRGAACCAIPPTRACARTGPPRPSSASARSRSRRPRPRPRARARLPARERRPLTGAGCVRSEVTVQGHGGV
jgi:hypothetical protein